MDGDRVVELPGPNVPYGRRVGVAAFHLDELNRLEAHLVARGGDVVVQIGDQVLEHGVADLPQVRLKLLRETLTFRVAGRRFTMELGRYKAQVATTDGELGAAGRRLVDEVAGILDVRRYDPAAVLRLLVVPLLGVLVGAALVVTGLILDLVTAATATYVVGGMLWFTMGAAVLFIRRERGAAVYFAITAAEADRERRRRGRDLAFVGVGAVLSVLVAVAYEALRTSS